MTVFVKNLKKYIESKHYKHSFVAQNAGIEVNKFSRIINEKQDVTEKDMFDIADALGREAGYFMSKDFKISDKTPMQETVTGFYLAGSMSKEVQTLANKIYTLMNNFDAVVGAKKRMDNHFAKEVARELRKI